MKDPDEDKVRASGLTPAQEETREVAKEADQEIHPELPDERERRFQTHGFSRMRTDWRGPDAVMMSSVHTIVSHRIAERFSDAFEIMYELYDVVREPVIVDGVPKVDEYGMTEWKIGPSGKYIEDWSKLTLRQRERFLYLITTRLFDWTQKSAELWGESMMAKALWEEAFAIGFESTPGGKATIDDRRARGTRESAPDRYFAILTAYYSRKADAIVRTMELLSQRLKDVHTA